jgi:hypothetical protein
VASTKHDEEPFDGLAGQIFDSRTILLKPPAQMGQQSKQGGGSAR